MNRRTSLYRTFSKVYDLSLYLNQPIKRLFHIFNSDNSSMDDVYDQALQIVEFAERLVLVARALPAYTGRPQAQFDVEKITKESFPVEIGFTKQGWFSVRIPVLLPKKESGSAEYIRSSLYPAMADFFNDKNPIRYDDCVLIYRHVYSKNRPERRKRDHDNIEVNIVSNIVAFYVMPDDGPDICSHYYCSAEGTADRTEIYVVPKNEFSKWINAEKKLPKKGAKLYEATRISSKKQG